MVLNGPLTSLKHPSDYTLFFRYIYIYIYYVFFIIAFITQPNLFFTYTIFAYFCRCIYIFKNVLYILIYIFIHYNMYHCLGSLAHIIRVFGRTYSWCSKQRTCCQCEEVGGSLTARRTIAHDLAEARNLFFVCAKTHKMFVGYSKHCTSTQPPAMSKIHIYIYIYIIL